MNKKLFPKKRIRIAIRNYHTNRAYKSSIKTTVKNCILSIKRMNKDSLQHKVSLNLAEAFSRIDKSVKRKIIHKNKGARKKSFLSNLFKQYYEKL